MTNAAGGRKPDIVSEERLSSIISHMDLTPQSNDCTLSPSILASVVAALRELQSLRAEGATHGALASRKPREGDAVSVSRDELRRWESWFQIQSVAHTGELSAKAKAIWTSMQRALSPADVPLPPSAGETSSAPGVCGTCGSDIPGGCPDCTGRVAAIGEIPE